MVAQRIKNGKGWILLFLVVSLAGVIGLTVPVSATADNRSATELPQVVQPSLAPPTEAYRELRARAHRVPSGRQERPLTTAPVVNPAR